MRRFVSFLMICLVVAASPVRAQDKSGEMDFTLERIFRHVYEHSPTLLASRAKLRALHELHPQALSGWRPTVEAQTSIYSTDIDSSNFSGATGATTKSVELSVNQPLYRGGKTTDETKKAQNQIKAGYARLLQDEQDAFLKTAIAYMNVIRDRVLLNLRINNEKLLEQELHAIEERYNSGDLTKTDVQQAKSRLARARAEHVSASGILEDSRASFEAIVGFPPDDTLYMPNSYFIFPASIEEMIAAAENDNPAIISSKNEHAAAENLVDSRFDELLPQISAFASYNKEFDPQPGIIDQSETQTIGIRAKLMLYQGGYIRSLVREAKNTATQRYMEIGETRDAVSQDITSNWKSLESARAEIVARNEEINATQQALEGVREEEHMGERTVLDILDAEQEVLDAQAALTRAQRDQIVSSFALAAALGLLLPEKMGMADIVYDPGPHYREVSSRIFSMEAE